MGAFTFYGLIVCGLGFLMFVISQAAASDQAARERAEAERQEQIEKNRRNIFRD